MRLNLIRSFVVLIGVAAIILVAPIVCAASADSMNNMVNEAQAASHFGEGAVVPQWSTTVSPLSPHVLMNALSEQATPPRLVPAGVILSWSPVNLNIEPSPTQTRPLQRDIVYIIIYIVLTSILLEYHCRNYPNSEEPPL